MPAISLAGSCDQPEAGLMHRSHRRGEGTNRQYGQSGPDDGTGNFSADWITRYFFVRLITIRKRQDKVDFCLSSMYRLALGPYRRPRMAAASEQS